MNWKKIESEEEINELLSLSQSSETLGVIIFKHSPRCSISNLAKMRLQSGWSFGEEVPVYILNVIQKRDISLNIADQLNVQHESPQLLLLKNRECIYNASHIGVSPSGVEKVLKK